MNRSWKILGLLTIALAASPAQAADDSLKPLLAWGNKYPFDKVDGKDFWAFEPLAQRLRAMMGMQTHQFFMDNLAHGVVTPVYVKDGILWTDMCEPHNCVAVHAYLFVDTNKDKAYACLRNDDKEQYFWFVDGAAVMPVGEDDCMVREGEKAPLDLFNRMRKG